MQYQSPTEIMKRVGVYMSVTMPTNKDKLANHLIGLDGCRHDLAQKTAEWHMLLADKKRQVLHPKDKDLTELDRNVMLEANVSIIRSDYEFLVRLEELVKDRIDLGKVLLTL